jgi:hypothetical protein
LKVVFRRLRAVIDKSHPNRMEYIVPHRMISGNDRFGGRMRGFGLLIEGYYRNSTFASLAGLSVYASALRLFLGRPAQVNDCSLDCFFHWKSDENFSWKLGLGGFPPLATTHI